MYGLLLNIRFANFPQHTLQKASATGASKQLCRQSDPFQELLRNNQAMSARRLLRIFAIITAIGAYLMILLGVLVTTTGSGHGCGNTWPFCHGEIIPGTLTIQGVIEYGHRIMASVDGFLVLILTVWAWLTYRKDFRVRLFAALSLLFVILQGALGAVTVVYEGTWALNWILSIHFGLSLIAFASVVLLTVRLFQLGREEQAGAAQSDTAAPGLRFPLWSLAIYTYIVVYTGALVEHTGAVVGCGYQLPTCGPTFLPSFTTLAGIQVLHRYLAGLLWFGVLFLLVTVLRRYRERGHLVCPHSDYLAGRQRSAERADGGPDARRPRPYHADRGLLLRALLPLLPGWLVAQAQPGSGCGEQEQARRGHNRPLMRMKHNHLNGTFHSCVAARL